uniref:Nicotinate phosphoribosyltransferase n=1 Tax=Xenopsylla cheopis TaxID=163159 RepID=A0A6M2DTH3_XENCH
MSGNGLLSVSLNDGGRNFPGQNNVVQPLLTDLYQITMAYAYWKSGKTTDVAVFDLFFRTNPFQGEFTIFAGLEECLKFLENFRYSDDDIEYLKVTLPIAIEPEFFSYLRELTANDVTLYALEEGSVAFPRVPLLRIEGPLIIVQLLETTLLNLVNYASLMATNAARYRMVAGKNVSLLEFGLRRAQGPDGGLSASKYAYIGGFDGTSNVLAGKLFNIPVKGTHAHSYITSFTSVEELRSTLLQCKKTSLAKDLRQLSIDWRQKLSTLLDIGPEEASDGELAALISFAIAFPDGFMALVDTYDVKRYPSRMTNHNCTTATSDHSNFYTNNNSLSKNNNYNNTNTTNHSNSVEISTNSRDVAERIYRCQCQQNIYTYNTELVEKALRSGLLNFCSVAMALNDLGYKAVGIRIDSGDLAYLSVLARETFETIAEKYNIPWFARLMIIASNDINEDTILSLNEQGHKIDCFGIGTHLVTCQRQPALGCVYKMVEINGQPRIKLSQDVAKVTMPGRKNAYRLYGADGHALIDLLQRTHEPAPQIGQKVLCRHAFQESKRAYVIPSRVEALYKLYWKDGHICQPLPSLIEVKNRVQASLKTLRQDLKRNLNPTPYKVAVSDELYSYIHNLWLQNAPIGELS